MKNLTKALQSTLIQALFLSLVWSGSLAAQEGNQLFIPIGVGDITTFIPVLPSPDTSVTLNTQTVGGDIYDISWNAISNADYYQIQILAEDGSITKRRVESTDYSLAGLPLGTSTVTLLACNAQDQCGSSASIGSYSLSERVRYAHADILGSPILETDQAANVLQEFHYRPFGETEEEKQEDIGYTGHLEDTDLALTYMQARYYDPVIGRFYGNDPVEFNNIHNFNRYAYANNNPYKYVDPDGRDGVNIGATLKILGIGITNTVSVRFPGFSKEPFDLQLQVGLTGGFLGKMVQAEATPVTDSAGLMVAKATVNAGYDFGTSEGSGVSINLDASAGAVALGGTATVQNVDNLDAAPIPSSFEVNVGPQLGAEIATEVEFTASGRDLIEAVNSTIENLFD